MPCPRKRARVDLDVVLLGLAAEADDVDDASDLFELTLEDPVLGGLQVARGVSVPLHGVPKHFTDGVPRGDGGLHSGGQGDEAEAVDDLLARLVVGSVPIEVALHVAQPEERLRARVFQPLHAGQPDLEGDRHVAFDFFGAPAVRLGDDLDKRWNRVRIRLDIELAVGGETRDDEDGRRRQHDEGHSECECNEALNHGSARRLRRARSISHPPVVLSGLFREARHATFAGDENNVGPSHEQPGLDHPGNRPEFALESPWIVDRPDRQIVHEVACVGATRRPVYRTQGGASDDSEPVTGRRVAKDENLDGHRPPLSEPRGHLAGIDDDDFSLRREVHDFLTGVSSASSFDEIEAGAHLVGPVDVHVDGPRPLVAEHGDPEARGQGASPFRGRDADDASPRAHERSQLLDENTCGRSAP